MTGCACDSGAAQVAAKQKRRGTLRVVMLINAIMFLSVFLVGMWADSRALLADSADNLGDAMVYGLSLMAVSRSHRWTAGAALIKGLIQLIFGIAVIGGVVQGVLTGPEPKGIAIISTAFAALAANLVCFGLLWKHRGEDINMRSVWLCSRNDVFSNAGVIVAGFLVLVTTAAWPDLLVGAIIALIFVQTAYVVIRDGWKSWRTEAEN